LDDDAEQLRDFGMEANWPHKKVALDLSAAEFSRIGWITSLLGPQAVIHPGQLKHARAAIQFLFCTIQTEHILNDLGSTLRFRSVTPDRFVLPLLAAVYRAPLGKVDFRRLSYRPHRDVQDRSGHSL
jgi:hypothetical protein